MVKKLKILAAGDIHGNEAIAENLAIKAEKNKVDLVVLAGDLSHPLKKEKLIGHFKERGLEAVFIPGNWDSDIDIKFIKNTYGTINLEDGCLTIGDVNLFGIGNANFKLDHDSDKDFKRIEEIFKNRTNKSNKNILVSHLHAAGTKAEFSGFKGSYVLRKLIEEIKPNVVISSHIHEAEGIEEKINNTKIFQVGQLGTIIEI